MKKIISILFISITTLVSFISCKKSKSSEQKTTLSGVVVRFPSKQAVVGQKVYLVKQGVTVIEYDMNVYWRFFHLDTLVRPPMYRMDSTMTDAGGRFSFAYDPADCKGFPCGGVFYATLIDPAYIVLYHTSQFSKDTMFVDSPSYFKLNMHKSTAATLNDTVFENRIFLSNQSTYFFRSPLYLRKAQIGKTHTTIIDTFSYNATNKVILEWRHYKFGLVSSSTDTISLIPNGTKEYNVFY